MSLNVHGLIDDDKRQRLFKMLKDQEIDVACIQETHAGPGEVSWWSQQWRGPSIWTSAASTDDRSAGTAMLFGDRFSANDVKLIRKDDVKGRFVHALLAVSEGANIRLAGLYAPSVATERREFFVHQQEMLVERSDDDENDDNDDAIADDALNVIMGDFNCVENPALDRVAQAPGASEAASGIVQLLALTAALNTIDIWREQHPKQRATTWRNGTGGSRLDRVYLDKTLLSDASSGFIRCTFSDHDAAVCTLHVDNIKTGDGYWRLNVSVLNHDEFQTSVRDIIQNTRLRLDLSASERWELIKFNIRHFAMEYCAKIAKARAQELKDAKSTHARALENWTSRPTDANAAALASARANLERLQANEFKAAQARSRQKSRIDGERASKYFCQLEREQARERLIRELQHPDTGATCSTPEDICDATSAYYATLFRPDCPQNEDAIKCLLNRMPSSAHLDQEQQDLCDAPITIQDLHAALVSTADHKTPGLDGLPKDLYAAFWDDLGQPLLEMVHHAINTGALPSSCRQGLVCLVFKKRGDRRSLGNYRPLTMLTADYKLVSKVLAQRLDRVIDHLVHPDQTGFIRRRFILENVMAVRSIRQRCDRLGEKGVLLFLDQEKAFDRVSWTFRDRVLKHVGFGTEFRKIVQLLHRDVHGQVLTNGFLSPRFPILRGTRQGDPLSPGLFALLDEPLACSLRADPLFKGIKMPEDYGRDFKLAQYADDKGIGLGDNDDAVRLNEHLRLYEDASAAKINTNKSAALLLGPATSADFTSLNVPILQAGESTKYLGVKIGPDVSDRDIWVDCMVKLQATLAQWARRNLSIAGRITVIKVLATSKLWYAASVIPVPKDILEQMDRAVWRFLWKGKISGPVRRAVCLAPRSSGGLGMIDIASVISALQLSWLKRLLDNGDGKWKDLALDELRSCSAAASWGLDTRVLLTDAHKIAEIALWSNVLKTAQRLHLREAAPESFEQVLRQHLFRNSAVLDINGNALKTQAMRNAATNGIAHIRDLLDSDGNIRAREDLGLSKTTVGKIIGALPDRWRTFIEDGQATLSAGEWFLDDLHMPTRRIHRVSSVQQDVITFDRFVVNTDGTFETASPTTCTDLIADFKFVRAHVTEHRHGFLCHGPQQLLELDPATLTLDQRVGSATFRIPLLKSTVNASSRALTAHKAEVVDFAAKWPGLPMPWKRVFKWMRTSHRDRQVNDLLFKLVHRSLPLGERRFWDPELNVSCPCGQDLETVEHLFCECAVAASVWAWFINAWKLASGQPIASNTRSLLFGSVPPSRVRVNNKTYWSLFALVQPEVLYTIWLTRNRWVFEEQEYSVLVIKAVATARILRTCQAAAQLHQLPGFQAMFDSLYSHLQDV
jgi:exonuclease III